MGVRLSERSTGDFVTLFIGNAVSSRGRIAAVMLCVLMLACPLLMSSPADAADQRPSASASSKRVLTAKPAGTHAIARKPVRSGKTPAAAAKERAAKAKDRAAQTKKATHAAHRPAASRAAAHRAAVARAQHGAVVRQAALARAAKAKAAAVAKAAARAKAAAVAKAAAQAKAAAAKAAAEAKAAHKAAESQGPTQLAPGGSSTGRLPISQDSTGRSLESGRSAFERGLAGAAQFAGLRWPGQGSSLLPSPGKLADRLAAAEAAARLRAEAEAQAAAAARAAAEAARKIQGLLPTQPTPSTGPKPSQNPTPPVVPAQPAQPTQPVTGGQGGPSQAAGGQAAPGSATGPAATPPARSASRAPSSTPAPPKRSRPIAGKPQQVVLAIPKRIGEATLSVGLLPLVLLIVVALIAAGLVIVGTRRPGSLASKASDRPEA
ncbi:MAG: hypothetical protein QOE53_2698 [Pseudonocardiales bacterium]|nr:hypothetical protein [Pseudonocardiales bacterium]